MINKTNKKYQQQKITWGKIRNETNKKNEKNTKRIMIKANKKRKKKSR